MLNGCWENSKKNFRGLLFCRTLYTAWLNVTERIEIRLCVQVYKCQYSMASGYLINLWRATCP